MAFCNSCGGALEAGAKFCPKCGAARPGGAPVARRRGSASRLPRSGQRRSDAQLKIILIVLAVIVGLAILSMGTCPAFHGASRRSTVCMFENEQRRSAYTSTLRLEPWTARRILPKRPKNRWVWIFIPAPPCSRMASLRTSPSAACTRRRSFARIRPTRPARSTISTSRRFPERHQHLFQRMVATALMAGDQEQYDHHQYRYPRRQDANPYCKNHRKAGRFELNDGDAGALT